MVSSDQAETYLLACTSIVRDLIAAFQSSKEISLNELRNRYAKKLKLKGVPRLVDILSAVPVEWQDRLRGALRAKPVRTASGIAVVAVMCKPHRCPHVAMTGNICVYCPGGPDSDFEYSTQSYTGYEPTSMRAIRARYDPYEQARGRIDQLKGLGHSVDKVEIIIMGGTFMSMPEDYRHKFVAGLHNALSGYTGEDIDEAVKYSEQSKTKCVGITIETRPDYCLKPHLSQMLRYGCTRLEIGVQSVYEDVARDTNRGHTVRSVTESFHLAKDAGYKIVAHMMPDLPNCGVERDIWQFQEFFENPAFRSDGLKLYPTLVIRGTGLYELWRMGKYKNYTPNALVDIVARILALVPPWTRVYRVQRDIPMPLVSSGVENGNLRQLALDRMKDFGAECRDVRYREVGMSEIHQRVRPQSLELLRRDYTANGGWETFLSYEDPEQDILVGLLRLRKCSEDGTFRKELTGMVGGCSMVRELHVYGTAVGVHSRDPKVFQHQGIGTLLMEEAERIARDEHGSGRIAVISGVGTRDYYRRLGYKLEGPYMIKDLELMEDEDYAEEADEEEVEDFAEFKENAKECNNAPMSPTAALADGVTPADAAGNTSDSSQAGPSLETIAAALAAQSSFRSQTLPELRSLGDLPAGEAKVQLCKTDLDASSRNIYCTREGCGSLILAAGVANWVVAEGGVLPADSTAPFPPAAELDAAAHPAIQRPTPYWHVTGVPMCFENIGFTRTTTDGMRKEGKIKWLICAECDLGPIGWCYEGGREAWLAVSRVKYGPAAA